MACSIVATASSASANSYCTIADADTYHETHIAHETWDDADSDDKCRALQTATRLLDQWYEWQGSPTTLTQALQWPRNGVTGTLGFQLDSSVIPTLIEQATAELARQLLDSDRTADSSLETQGLASLNAGPVSMTFRSTPAKPIPDAVQIMVGPLGQLRSRSGGGAVTLYRA